MENTRVEQPVWWWGERIMIMVIILYFTMYPRNAASDFAFCTLLCGLLYFYNKQFDVQQPKIAVWAVADGLFLSLGIVLFLVGGYWGYDAGHLNVGHYIAIVITYFYYGFIQHYLAQCYLSVRMLSISKGNNWLAAVLTGLAFGFLHLLEKDLIIPSIIGGALFAFYYLSRGRLWVVVVVHALISTALIYGYHGNNPFRSIVELL